MAALGHDVHERLGVVAVGAGRLEEGTGALMGEDAAGPVDLRGEQVHPLVP